MGALGIPTLSLALLLTQSWWAPRPQRPRVAPSRAQQLLSYFLRLQDLSSGYWVLVVHFTRREAVKHIEVLQHVATNLGRSE